MPPRTSPTGDRFSLEDPEAGKRLIETLARNRVRLTFTEACICFGCKDDGDRGRVLEFLFDLTVRGQLIEIEQELYCLPTMTGENKRLRDELLKDKGYYVSISCKRSKRRKKDVAPMRLFSHEPSRAERWLLRKLRVCGRVVTGRETFDAAVRGGAAADDLEAAEALASLEKRGWIKLWPERICALTPDGQRAAEAAVITARLLGDPPIAFSQPLPDIVWVDDA